MKRNIIHDGVSIKIFETDDPQKVIIHFTDEITAFNKIKKAVIKDKGVYCNGISCEISRLLQKGGVPTHFIEQISDTEQLCWKSQVIPMEVIVRNVIAGSMAQRLGLEEGIIPKEPVYDLCYKSDILCDPIINDYHAGQRPLLGHRHGRPPRQGPLPQGQRPCRRSLHDGLRASDR